MILEAKATRCTAVLLRDGASAFGQLLTGMLSSSQARAHVRSTDLISGRSKDRIDEGTASAATSSHIPLVLVLSFCVTAKCDTTNRYCGRCACCAEAQLPPWQAPACAWPEAPRCLAPPFRQQDLVLRLSGSRPFLIARFVCCSAATPSAASLETTSADLPPVRARSGWSWARCLVEAAKSRWPLHLQPHGSTNLKFLIQRRSRCVADTQQASGAFAQSVRGPRKRVNQCLMGFSD